MSVCICPPRRDGSRRCKEHRTNSETGALSCGLADAAEEALTSALDADANTPGEHAERVAGVRVDPVIAIRALRLQGWTVIPRRGRARDGGVTQGGASRG